jgi:cobalt-zinc-cadmium resistance protein CzcA
MSVEAQQLMTLDQAIQQARQSNKNVQASMLAVKYQEQIKRTSSDMGKTNFLYMQGQYNSYAKDDNNITVTQSIPFPSVFAAQGELGKSLIKGSELRQAATENELTYQVRQVYYQLSFLVATEALLVRQDSILANFVKAAEVRYRTGEIKLLEKTTAETHRNELLNSISLIRSDIQIYQQLLKNLTGNKLSAALSVAPFEEHKLDVELDTSSMNANPELAYQRQQIEIASAERKVTNAHILPDINVGYFNQTLINTPLNANGDLATKSDRFQGFLVGLSIPVWFAPHSAKARAARIKEERISALADYHKVVLSGQWTQAVQLYQKNRSSVEYYRASALQNAELILTQSQLAFKNGEIDYIEYLLSVRSAMQIRENYLVSLNNLNQSIITLEFLSGNYQ